MSGQVHVLGPQRPRPNLREVLRHLGTDGPVGLITAGWRHEERELASLQDAVGLPCRHVPLYGWFEQLQTRDPDLAARYRARQARMLAARRLYRARLGSTLEGLAAVEGVREVESALQDAAVVAGLVAVRQVDADFQALIDGIRADEPELDRAWELPQVARWADELTDTMAACETLCIAGGHVAVLRNRMDFFGLPGRLQGHLERGGHVVGWSAGAMLLTEQIVLYYDDPPEGPTDAEVLDRGLGLVPGLVLFPHSRLRLRIADRPRLARLTRRLAPRHCLGLEPGAWLAPEGTGWVSRGASDALVDLADPEASGHWRSR